MPMIIGGRHANFSMSKHYGVSVLEVMSKHCGVSVLEVGKVGNLIFPTVVEKSMRLLFIRFQVMSDESRKY